MAERRVYSGHGIPESKRLLGVFIPIPFPGTNNTLCATVCKGVRVPYDGPCPRCPSKGSFIYTGWFVQRGAVIDSGVGVCRYEKLSIALARCKDCGRWARVLSMELLPRKTYGWQVIQRSMFQSLFTKSSLRKAVLGIVWPDLHAPHYSTLCR